MEENRVQRSWRLIGVAMRLVKRDRTMLVVAGLGALFSVLAAVVIFDLAGYFHHPSSSRGRLAVIALIAAWPLTFVGTFFNVALAAAADAALDGRQLTLRQAFAVSVRKLGQIALWSLLAAGVGVLLQQIAERVPFGGRLLSWLLGAGWSLLTIFAVPVLAIEGCGAPRCVRRSAELLRSRWGEGIAGSLTITAALMVFAIPAGLLLGAGGGVLVFDPTLGVALLLAGIVALMLVNGVSMAVNQVFAVALYRFAADGDVEGGFPEGDLQRPFQPKRKGLFRRTSR